MKNKIVLFMIMVFALMLNALCVTATPTELVVNPIDTFTDIFVSLGSLSLVVPVLVQFVKKWAKLEKDFYKQLTAWIISFVLVIVGKLLSLGFLEAADWVDTVLYGLALGLISNGVFDISLIKKVLQTIFKLRKT